MPSILVSLRVTVFGEGSARQCVHFILGMIKLKKWEWYRAKKYIDKSSREYYRQGAFYFLLSRNRPPCKLKLGMHLVCYFLLSVYFFALPSLLTFSFVTAIFVI